MLWVRVRVNLRAWIWVRLWVRVSARVWVKVWLGYGLVMR